MAFGMPSSQPDAQDMRLPQAIGDTPAASLPRMDDAPVATRGLGMPATTAKPAPQKGAYPAYMTEMAMSRSGEMVPAAPGWQQKKAYYDAAGNNIAPWEINRDSADLARYLANYKQSYTEMQGQWNPAGAYYDKTGVFRVPGLNA